MKQFIVVVLFLILPNLSQAMRVSFFPISLQHRYLENQSSEMYFQRINSFSAGLTFEHYQLGIETGRWSTSSGTDLVGFNENSQEINTTHLLKMGTVYEWLYFYSGIGIGSYESELTTQFNGVNTVTKSGQTLYGSGVFSIQAIYWYFHFTTELKLIFAKDYQPQPTPDLTAKLGISF